MSQYYHYNLVEAEENNEKYQSTQPVPGQRFKPDIPYMQMC
jgi:hypothetical protein